MHELSIAQSLLDIIDKEIAPYGKAHVIGVRLRVGSFSGIVPDALRFAFEVLSKEGSAYGAALEIEIVPLRIRCNTCKEVFSAEDPFMICPRCEGFDVEMISGKELEIKELEIEDGEGK